MNCVDEGDSYSNYPRATDGVCARRDPISLHRPYAWANENPKTKAIEWIFQ